MSGSSYIKLFTYLNCFPKCSKYRPGFMLGGKIWCLTHTKPRKYLTLSGGLISGAHWQTNTEIIYLTQAVNPAVRRLNNNSGGTLEIDSVLAMKICTFTGADLRSVHQILTKITKKMQKFLFIESLPFPATQDEMGIPKADQIMTIEGIALAPAELFTKLLQLDPMDEDDALKLQTNGAVIAVKFFKGLTLKEAIALIPAFDPEKAIAALPGITEEQMNELLPKCNLVLNNNPNTNAAAGDALLEIAGILGIEPDLTVYEPAKDEQVDALVQSKEENKLNLEEGVEEKEETELNSQPVEKEETLETKQEESVNTPQSEGAPIDYTPAVQTTESPAPMTRREQMVFARFTQTAANKAAVASQLLDELKGDLAVLAEVLEPAPEETVPAIEG